MSAPIEPANENIDPSDERAEPTSEMAGPEPKSDIESLEEKIAALEADLAKQRDQWVRAVAETENVRKRGERDLQETIKYASSGFARDMVDVLETLKRASESISAHARSENDLLKTVGDGLDMTLKDTLATFERHGIRRIDPLNQKFDHNHHQAVVQVERDDVPAGTVVQVVQTGYTMHDRLLRPAMVAVSKQAGSAKKVDTEA